LNLSSRPPRIEVMSEPDVFEEAMKIARVEYPALKIDLYRSRLDQLATKVSKKIKGKGRRAVGQLNTFFFDELGFHGDIEDYDNPRNHYLNDVIDRRAGIPITLSIVYCEIARRLGVAAYGVGFPGHFLVKCLVEGSELLVDCFNGKLLTRDGCQELLDSLHASPLAVSDEMLRIASAREILSRMLNNLRRVHADRGDFRRAIRWVQMNMDVRPDVTLLRERGMLYVRVEEFGKAVVDLERYARLVPDASDLPQVREQLRLLGKLLSHLN
jgi:regulator of sirC expression with transglutaminase-like and TPR domain